MDDDLDEMQQMLNAIAAKRRAARDDGLPDRAILFALHLQFGAARVDRWRVEIERFAGRVRLYTRVHGTYTRWAVTRGGHGAVVLEALP